LEKGNVKKHFWKNSAKSTGSVHFVLNTCRQVSKYDNTRSNVRVVSTTDMIKLYGSRFTYNTSTWQYFDVVQHRLPVEIRGWNFASIIPLTGLTNREGALVSGLNFTFLDHKRIYIIIYTCIYIPVYIIWYILYTNIIYNYNIIYTVLHSWQSHKRSMPILATCLSWLIITFQNS